MRCCGWAGCKRVATEPECPGKIATLREILQTRRTDGQELCSLRLSLWGRRDGSKLADLLGRRFKSDLPRAGCRGRTTVVSRLDERLAGRGHYATTTGRWE
jgi:hypothetical protein